jgi:hypothetical protein
MYLKIASIVTKSSMFAKFITNGLQAKPISSVSRRPVPNSCSRAERFLNEQRSVSAYPVVYSMSNTQTFGCQKYNAVRVTSAV